MLTNALNQILYGPPGTGKTFATVELALEILDPEFLKAHRLDRKAVKRRFDELSSSGDVRFVTFHQSFSYEDFVEGLRADRDDDGQLKYAVEDGVFKTLCNSAAARVTRKTDTPIDIEGRRIWKMSLGNTLGDDAYIYDECIENGYALLGYGSDVDFSGCKTRDEVFERFVAAGKLDEKDSYAVTAVTNFLLKMKKGDLLVISEGNTKFRAFGEVTGDYRPLARETDGDDKYGQCRDVKWLRVYSPSLPHEQLMHNQFSQMTLYELKPSAIDRVKLAALLNSTSANVSSAESTRSPFRVGDRFGTGYDVVHISPDIVELIKPNKRRLPIGMSLIRALAEYVSQGDLTLADIKEKRVFDRVPNTLLEPYLVNGYENILSALVERFLSSAHADSTPKRVPVDSPKVLIIDEINRGNVSRIFGELITLIEPSKRANASEALELTLPYSKTRFSVPANLYIIGTMNTADRSLTGLDIALRRRFVFREMLPLPERLKDVELQGLNIGRLLAVMNNRIEVLLDRDHRLGHAYFLSLKDDLSLDNLASIFRQQIFPLLQEYFFDDWSRIQQVLNDHRKAPVNRFLQQPKADMAMLFGEQTTASDRNERWIINDDAFSRIEAYLGIIDHQILAEAVGVEREAVHGDLTIKQLQSGTIELWKGGVRLEPARPTLLAIANELGLDTNYLSGTQLNTRDMGKRVIDAIGK
ncbi:AAA family ATPase [Bradyrhizobium sp. CCBAU 45394]|uniref:AAA family ATPase n=1 Tax=Bradyrhizobium sp. CCBAU 45394 TaxID=1325087 RepID=UPI002303235B|nr:AAA family ATPase [Bradyrhizobium sp. CCBAU 45394]